MKKVLFCILLITFLVIIYCFINKWSYKKYEIIGEQLIRKVENYHELKGKFPDKVEDFGEVEAEGIGPYYLRIRKNQYKIVFCIDFDKYYIYNSRNKKWSECISVY